MEEFRCFFCGKNADRLAYYSKDYPSGKSTIENPRLVCSQCYFDKDIRNKLNLHRGGIEGISSYTFQYISKATTKTLGFISGKRNYEINDLSTSFWRKQLFRIHYRNLPRKETM